MNCMVINTVLCIKSTTTKRKSIFLNGSFPNDNYHFKAIKSKTT